MKNLVLGAVENYQRRDIVPFIRSLEAVGYSGDVVFFVSNISSDLRSFLRDHGVRMVSYRRLRGPIARGLRIIMNWFLDRFRRRFNRELVSPRHPLFRYIWHIHASRYFLYFEYMKSVNEEYELILLTDVRDVVFQRDPFTFEISGSVCTFEEYPGISIGQEFFNSWWIRDLFGESCMRGMRDRTIYCSGVTFGTQTGIQSYLNTMTDLLSRRHGPYRFDQGAHNYIVYKELLHGLQLFQFQASPIVHLGITPFDLIRLSRSGDVLNASGAVAHVVHQYDRHPVIEEMYMERFGNQ